MRCEWLIGLMVALAAVAAGCSSTRHVPEGQLLLDDVKISINDSTDTFHAQEMLNYVRQRPNNRIFHVAKLRLGFYNMSGKDSTKWWNKWMRKLGEAPVIYDRDAMEADARQLRKAMNNAGYLSAKVKVEEKADSAKKKMHLRYNLDAGLPHIIRSVDYSFYADSIGEVIMRDSARFLVHPGQRLDRSVLDLERERIATRLRNHGYWGFSKQYITFNADTTEGSRDVALTMRVNPPLAVPEDQTRFDTHARYMIRDIFVIPSYEAATDPDPREYQAHDTVRYKDITVLYGAKHYLRPSVLYDACHIRAGHAFSQRDVDNTYSAFGRLPILNFTNVKFYPVATLGDTHLLDAYILLTPGRSQSIALELEGTNSEGDFGVAASVNYTHRNVGHGAETLALKVRGSYQSLTGNLEGFIHNRFMEYGVETSVTFPKFKAPLLRENFKRKIKAETEFHISLNYQERPEYTRIISTAGWSYKWTERNQRHRYTLTPIDINYVYLPHSTNDFIDQIAPDNPLLRYSYEDHFIMRAGFNFYYTNKRAAAAWRPRQKDVITVRANAEIAGNLLFALNSIINHRSNFHENPYRIFGIHYSQYVRVDGDFSYLHSFSRRNALACYAGIGVGVPYGNSSVMPFEKRFYGGGANGVRGWDVRTLGPGRYPGANSVSDFMKQCGDIRLNLSLEYRVKLFWVVEAGLFIDMGNIWTIRDYPSQPYGAFRFKNFYKELAAAYGVGMRLDFNYFLIRLDLGMKAHNPAINEEPWPLIHPRWGRDRSLHFSIGYPF